MEHEELERLFGGSLKNHDIETMEPSDPDELKQRFLDYSEKHTFQPGDLVQWKPGMRNKKIPAYGSPVIVVDVLASPVFDDSRSGTPVWHEPLDVRLGLIYTLDDDRDFDVYYFDSRRFEPFPEKKLESPPSGVARFDSGTGAKRETTQARRVR
jgi:hypothetical protein